MAFSDIVYKILGWNILAHTEIDGKGIYVVKKRNERVLVYDHTIHSQILDKTLYTHQYWDYFLPIPSIYQKPKILIMGLGGGTIPYQLRKLFGSRIDIDVVEISKKMVAMSKVFLPERVDMKIIIGDGYSYISKKKNTYDIIIMDSYVGGVVPDEVFEGQFLKDAKEALRKNGILAINYAFTPKSFMRKWRLYKRLKNLFKLYTLNYAHSAGNSVIICSKSYDKGELLEKMNKNFPIIDENKFLIKAFKNIKAA